MTVYYNLHTHFKPKLSNEVAIRNGYLTLNPLQYASLPYSVSLGLHPWHIHNLAVNEVTDALLERATLSTVKAIGEIGLDRAIDTPIPKQITYFESQLMVARALQKPIILHTVRSYSDIIPYVKKSKVPMIFHGFNGNIQQAKELIKHGALLSFGGGLQESKIADCFKQIPLTSLLLETDNNPHLSIAEVYAIAAQHLAIPEEELMHKMEENWKQLFG